MNSLVADLVSLGTAFLCGIGARAAGLPPLVGYLVAGFLLHAQGAQLTPLLAEFAQIGVTLLLFTIGLKLRLRNLTMPQVWAVSGLHMLLATGLGILCLAVLANATGLLAGVLEPRALALIAFALSFSSTVFAVKVLEDRGETASLYARIAIGILIAQDIAAVIYLGMSAGKVPSIWAAGLLLLIPLRPLLYRLLELAGRDELQILFGLSLALGGAQVFEQLGIKGDLGALILGLLLSGHERASELSRQLMGFKDLFLVGFFLSIGLSAPLGIDEILLGLLLLALVPVKGGLFFLLFTAFRLRVRTAFLAAMSLANYSEFGLIVMAMGVQQGLLEENWLVILAIALALSFLLAAPLNATAHSLYGRLRHVLHRFERRRRIPEEEDIDTGEARVIVFGMGRVGTGAYDTIRRLQGDPVLGVDIDEKTVAEHQSQGRNVIHGSATDPDFWARIHLDFRRVKLIMLTMPKVDENRFAAMQLKKAGYPGKIAATAKYDDEIPVLRSAGIDAVFNLYAEAGAGFAENVYRHLMSGKPLGQMPVS